MRKKYFIIFILSVSIIQGVYSQNKTTHFIITTEYDTLWGNINEDRVVMSNHYIIFKKEGIDDEIKFKPTDIRAYSNSEGHYVSAIVDVDYSRTEISRLSESPEPVMKRDSLYLKVLFKGAATLLFFRDDESKPHYFITANDSLYTELINYSYLAIGVDTYSNREYMKTVPKYKGVLSYYFADCPGAIKKIKGLSYSEKAFMEVFNEFQSCHNEQGVALNSRSKKVEIDFGLIAGVGKSKLFYTKDTDPVFTDFKYQPQLTLGVGVNIEMFGKLKGFSFNNELVMSRFHSVASVAYVNGIVSNYNEAHITSLDMALNSMIRFAFPIKSTAPYLTLGIRNSLIFLTENEIIRNSTIAEETTTATMPLLEAYKHFVTGLAFGAGLNYRNIGIEMRYNPQFGMDIDKRLIVSYSVSSLNLLLTYRLNNR